MKYYTMLHQVKGEPSIRTCSLVGRHRTVPGLCLSCSCNSCQYLLSNSDNTIALLCSLHRWDRLLDFCCLMRINRAHFESYSPMLLNDTSVHPHRPGVYRPSVTSPEAETRVQQPVVHGPACLSPPCRSSSTHFPDHLNEKPDRSTWLRWLTST